jgi:hypothetical protein
VRRERWFGAALVTASLAGLLASPADGAGDVTAGYPGATAGTVARSNAASLGPQAVAQPRPRGARRIPRPLAPAVL